VNEHDVIRQLGRFPDAINPSQRLMSKVWVCSQCGTRVETAEPTTIPKQCPCGSIGWTALPGLKVLEP
jgi:rubrerythrin